MDGRLGLYRLTALILSFVFAIVVLLFLLAPDAVLIFFNSMSGSVQMPEAPLAGARFYLILSVAYMYLVTLLAFMMYHHPHNTTFPLLLINAKVASSVVSIILFIAAARYLIYLTNFLVDGIIGVVVLLFYRRMKRHLL